MSQEIEQQIVKMEFDNKNFERNTKQSLSTIERLKRALNFDEEARSIKELEKAANHITLDDLGASLENLKRGFEGWGLVGKKIIWDLTSEFEKLGTKMISAMNAPFAQIKSGGWARAMKIKDAKFSIEGLGKNFDELKDDINDAVTNTAYGYDSAARAAAQFAASGIEAGKKFGQMGQALRSISGVAAQTNSSYDEIANIFTTIAANGKVMTLQLRQLSFRGMNASAVLAKSLGTTEAAVNEMVSKGQIDFATFAKAMDDAFGAHAGKANDTFQGALDNMKAALSRVGANFADPLIDAERDVYNRLRDIINSTNKMPLTEVGLKMQETWNKVFEKHPELKTVENMQEMNRKLAEQTTYLTEVGQAAKDELAALEALKKPTDKQTERMKYLQEQVTKGTVSGAGAVIRLANVVNIELENVRRKVLGFLESGDLNTALNNVIDSVAEIFTQIHGFIEPIAKAWRTVFDENEASLLARLTDEFKKFTQSLDLAREYGEDVYEVFTAVFTVFDIFKTVVGDVLHVIGTVGTKALQLFLKAAKPLSDVIIEIDYRFRQVRAAIIFIVEYFGEAAHRSQVLSNAFKGLVKVVRTLGAILGVIGTVLGGVVLTAVFLVITALSKLAGVASSIYSFLQPVISALGTFFVGIGKQIAGVIQAIVKPFTAYEKSANGVVKGTAKIGNKAVPILKTFVGIIKMAATVVRDFITNGLTNLTNAMSNFSLVDFVSGIRDRFISVIESIKSGAMTIPELLGKGVAAVIGGIINLFEKATNAAKNFFSMIFKGKKAVSGISGVADKHKGILDKIKDFFKSMAESDAMEKLSGGLKKITNGIKAFAKEITPARVFGIAFIATTVLMTKAIYDLIQSITGFVTQATNIPTSISDMFKSAKGVFDALKERIQPVKKASTQFKEIAEGIVMIAASVALLSKLKPDEIRQGGIALASILALMVIFHALISAIALIPAKAGKDALALTTTIGMFVGMAGALLAFTLAIKALSEIKVDFWTTIKNLGIALAGMAGLAAIIAGFSNFDKGIKSNFLVILSFAASLLLVTNAFKQLIGIPVGAMWAALIGLVPVLLTIGALSIALSNIKVTNSIGLLIVIGAIALSIPLLKKISKEVKWNQVTGALLGFLGVVAVLMAIAGAISFFTGSSFLKDFGEFGKGIMSIATAFGLMAIVAYFIGKVDPITMAKGSIVLIVFTAMVKSMMKAAGNTKENEMQKFARGLLVITVCFGIMTALMTIIGTMDWDAIKKGLVGIGFLSAFVAGLIWVTQFTKGIDSKGMGTIIAATTGLVGLSIILSILADKPWNKILPAAGAMLAVMVGYALVIVATAKLAKKAKKAGGAIAVLITVAASLAGLFYALKVLSDIPSDRLIPAMVSMAGVMVAYGAAIYLVQKSLRSFKSFKSIFSNIVILAESAAIFYILSQQLIPLSRVPWEGLERATMAMGTVMVTFAVSMRIIFDSLVQYQWKTMRQNLVLLGEMAVIILALSSVLIPLSNQPWQGILSGTLAMATVMLSFTYMMKGIFDNLKQYQMKTMLPNIALLGTMCGVLVGIGLVLTLLANQPWQGILASTVAMGTVMIAFTNMMKVIFDNLKQYQLKTMIPNMALLATVGGVLVGIGLVLTLLARQPWSGLLAAGAAMGACIYSYGKAIEMINEVKIDPSTLYAFLGALPALITIGTLLYLVAKQPWEGILAAGFAMSASLLSIGKMIETIGDVKVDVSTFVGLGIAIGTLTAVGIILYNVASLPWQGMLGATVAMSATLLSVGKMIQTIDGVKVDLSAIIGLGVAVGTMLAVGYVLNEVATLPWSGMIAAAVSMSLVLLSVGKMIETIDGVKVNLSSLLGFLGAVGVIISLGFALNMAAQQPWDSIAAAGGVIALCLLAVGFMIKIIGSVKVDPLVIVPFLGAVMVIVAIGWALSEVTQQPWQAIQAAGDAMLKVLAVLTIMITVLGLLPIGTGIAAALNLITFIGIMAGGLALINEISNALGGNGLDTIADLFGKLGEMVGKFIGGIGNGITSQMPDMGENLSLFAETSKTFFDLMKNVDGESILATMQGLKTGIETIKGLRFDDVNTEDYTKFGNAVAELGKGMKTFSKETSTVDPEDVEVKSKALVNIMSAMSKLPRNGGLAGGIFGDRESYDTFTDGLKALGPALLQFQTDTEGLKPESAETAATAMKMMNEFMGDIPRNGGLFGAIFGDRESYDDFKQGLEKLGPALLQFQKDTEGLKTEAIQQAATAFSMLTEIAKSIPNTGGVAGWWAGNNDIDTFADKLPTVGSDLSKFSKNLSGTSPTTVRVFAASIKDLADSAAAVANASSGTTALSNFASKLPSVATNLGKFYDNIPDDQTVKVTGFMKSMNSLKSFVSGFSNISTSNILSFTKDLTQMANTGLDVANQDIVDKLRINMAAAINDITDTFESFKAAGANQAGAFAEGVKGAFESVKTAWLTSIIDTVLNLVNNRKNDFKTSGAGMTAMFANGIAQTDKIRAVTDAAKSMAEKAIQAINDTIKNPYSASDAYKAGSTLANSFTMTDSDLAQFSNAGSSAVTAFATSISNGRSKATTAFGEIIKNVVSTIGSSDNQNKVRSAGTKFTLAFGNGINDSATVSGVRVKAYNVGKAALTELDRAIKDPAGVSDEAWKLGRAFTRGFGMGIENLQKYSDQASADIGYSAVSKLDDAIEDPAGVSDKSFNLGQAFSKGFGMGIESFMSAVNNAAAQLGIGAIGNLDLSLDGMKSRLKGFLSDFAGEDFANGLFGAISGVSKKKKNFKKQAKEFFDAFLPKEYKDALKDAGKDVGAGVDNALKTGKKGGKGGSKGKSKYAWTAKDLTETLLHLKNIFKLVDIEFDAYNKKFLKKGKVTSMYIAKSIKDNYLANAALWLDRKGSVSKKINKQADKIYKDIYDAELKAEKKRQKDQASKKGEKFVFNKAKAEGNIRAKAAKQATKEVVKNYEAENKVFNTMLEGMVKDKNLRKAVKSMPSVLGTFIDAYDPAMKGMSKNIDHLAKTGAAEDALKTYSDFAMDLYKQTDEYKDNTKELNKNAKSYDKLMTKAKKYQKIVNDPKASAKRKQNAKKHIEEISKEVTAIEKSNKKISKSMAKGPEKALKALRKELKETYTEFLSLSKIDFGKITSGFKSMASKVSSIPVAFDAASGSMSKFEKSTDKVQEKYDILNNTFDTGINLLEKFTKTGTAESEALLERAKSQLEAYTEFQNGIDKLRKTNLSESVIDSLEDQGPASLNYIRGFLSMTDEEIAKYNESVAKKEGFEASRLQRSMDRQLKQYQKWSDQIKELASQGLSEGIQQKLIDAGVNQAAFVNALVRMGQTGGLSKISEYYKNSLLDANKIVAENLTSTLSGASVVFNPIANLTSWVNGKSSWESDIAKAREKIFGAFGADQETLDALGLYDVELYVSDAVRSIIKSMEDAGMGDTKLLDWVNSASIDQLKEYVSLYEGAINNVVQADKTIRDYALGTIFDARQVREANDFLDEIKRQYGVDSTMYKTISEMGYEERLAFAKAYKDATPESKKLLDDALKEQDKVNKEEIKRRIEDRIDAIKRYSDKMVALEKTLPKEIMQEIKKAGPDDTSMLDYVYDLFLAGDGSYEAFLAKMTTVPGVVEDATSNVFDAMAVSNGNKLKDWATSAANSEEVKTAGTIIEATVTEAVNKGVSKAPEVAETKAKETVDVVASTFTDETNVEKVTAAAKSFGEPVLKELKKYISKKKGKKLSTGMVEGIAEGFMAEYKQIKNLTDSITSLFTSMARTVKALSDNAVGLSIVVQRASEEAARAATNTAMLALSSNLSAADALNGFNEALSSIRELMLSDMDMNPTIRPTLDLSDVTAKARALNSMFNDERLSANLSTNNQNEADGNGANGGMTFIQNNYSPKALDRLEIYRQTRNQFANAKGLVTI